MISTPTRAEKIAALRRIVQACDNESSYLHNHPDRLVYRALLADLEAGEQGWRPGDPRCDTCDNGIMPDWNFCALCGAPTNLGGQSDEPPMMELPAEGWKPTPGIGPMGWDQEDLPDYAIPQPPAEREEVVSHTEREVHRDNTAAPSPVGGADPRHILGDPRRRVTVPTEPPAAPAPATKILAGLRDAVLVTRVAGAVLDLLPPGIATPDLHSRIIATLAPHVGEAAPAPTAGDAVERDPFGIAEAFVNLIYGRQLALAEKSDRKWIAEYLGRIFENERRDAKAEARAALLEKIREPSEELTNVAFDAMILSSRAAPSANEMVANVLRAIAAHLSGDQP